MPIKINDDGLLINVIASEGILTDEDIDEYLDYTNKMMEKRKYILITDFSQAEGGIKPTQRKRIATSVEERNEYISRNCRASIIVVPQRWQRAMLSGIFLFVKPACPIEIVESQLDALKAANQYRLKHTRGT